MENGLIHLIIINWNGVHLLKGCLDGVLSQTYENRIVTVVDNGSGDGSAQYIKTNYPEVNLIELPMNIGFTVANNIAASNVRADYVALLNNDAVPDQDWLTNLHAALMAQESAGFAASKMLFYDRPETIDRAGDAFTKAGAASMRGRGRPSSEYGVPEWIFGACGGASMYRMEMIEEVGFFDDDFFLVYEDVDLSFRAQLQGYRCIYVPDAIVYHKGSQSIRTDSPVSVYYGHRNLEWAYIKNMPASLLFRTFIFHIVYDLAALIYFLLNGNAKPYIRAKWHAVKGFKRALAKRHEIQKNKKVGDEYIWHLMDNEYFFPRLRKRLKKAVD